MMKFCIFLCLICVATFAVDYRLTVEAVDCTSESAVTIKLSDKTEWKRVCTPDEARKIIEHFQINAEVERYTDPKLKPNVKIKRTHSGRSFLFSVTKETKAQLPKYNGCNYELRDKWFGFGFKIIYIFELSDSSIWTSYDNSITKHWSYGDRVLICDCKSDGTYRVVNLDENRVMLNENGTKQPIDTAFWKLYITK